MPPPMRPHDAAWKLLFSFPEMVRDLLAGFVPRGWVEDLDLSTLGRGFASHVSDDLQQRHGDHVWRVPFRGQPRDAMVLLECQSTVDRTMAVRMLAYTALLHQDLLRATYTGALPPVLPIVLYHGRKRWSAPEEMAGLAAPCGEHRAPYQPSQRYFLLDVGRYTDPLPPAGRNLVAELIRMARSPGPKEVSAVFAALAGRLSEPEHEGLIRAFWQWLGKVHLPARRVKFALPPLENWREAGTVLNNMLGDWRAPTLEEGRAEGAEGRAEGRIQGQADVMRRHGGPQVRRGDRGAARRATGGDRGPGADGGDRRVADRVRARRRAARPGGTPARERRGRGQSAASMRPAPGRSPRRPGIGVRRLGRAVVGARARGVDTGVLAVAGEGASARAPREVCVAAARKLEGGSEPC